MADKKRVRMDELMPQAGSTSAEASVDVRRRRSMVPALIARQSADLTKRKTVLSAMLPHMNGAWEATLEVSGQHTLQWPAFSSPKGKLPAGKCCVYIFPLICFRDERSPSGYGDLKPLADQELDLFSEMLLAITQDCPDMLITPDASGASLLHGLLISNHDDAVAIAMDMFEREPSLACEAHGPGLFIGENSLHLLCVHERERIASPRVANPRRPMRMCDHAHTHTALLCSPLS
jgi:hypothetical protein